MFLPFSAEATPPVCREDVPGLLWINTLGGFFLSRLLSARNLRAKVQQKNEIRKKKEQKIAEKFAYVQFLLYLCTII